MATQERLDKYLSHAGIGPRRNMRLTFKKHTITVNGEEVRSASTHIDPLNDVICVDGKQITKKGFVYFLLNKPKGFISTVTDHLDRDKVVDLIETDERIYPVGRLDKDTHGLLLLTNDGALTHKLIHPKFHIPKVYILTIEGQVTKEQLSAFEHGVLLRDGITQPAQISVIETREETSTLEITLHEGKYRQIRRMCETVGIILLDLQRIKFGPLTLENLEEGKYRTLTQEEVESLRKAVKK